MRKRHLVWVAIVVLALSSCALIPGLQTGATQSIALCVPQDEAVSFTVYNHYAGSEIADKHTVTDLQEVEWACGDTSLWARLAGEPQTYAPEELHNRLLTAVVITSADGSEQTYWAYRQPGYPSQTVLVTDAQEQFLLPTQYIDPYYASTAETIPASEVPAP